MKRVNNPFKRSFWTVENMKPDYEAMAKAKTEMREIKENFAEKTEKTKKEIAETKENFTAEMAENRRKHEERVGSIKKSQAGSYCGMCERQVVGKKKFSWILFILGVLLFGVGAFIYLVYYFFFQAKKCPICNNKVASR